MIYLLAAITVLLLLILFLVLPAPASQALRQPFQNRSFAHRGLHTKDRSVPENSLAAFAAAAEQKLGIELDVQLSKDGQVVVFHDDTLDRVTGVKGRVDAYSLKELQAMHLCGTENTIPLFTQVLDVVAGRGPLIVELKTGPRNRELCQKTLEILRQYQGDYCIESFDPTIVGWFKKNAPDILRGQLSDAQRNLTVLSPFKGFLLSRCIGNFLARPQFIAWGPGPKNLLVKFIEGLGAIKIRWTVHPEDDPATLQQQYDALIFEFYDAPRQW